MNNQVVLITGGTAGAGFEMAKILVEMGKNVIVCGRSAKRLEDVKKANVKIIPLECDVRLESDRQNLYDFINQKYGSLDMLVNNAGYAHRYSINTEDNLEQVTKDELETNYIAPILMTKLFLPLLKKASGRVVNITSGLAYVPLPIEPNYCASKAALHSYTISLRYQLFPVGIKVSEVFYPEMKTEFQQGQASVRAMDPKAAAGIAVKGLVKGKDEVHVGMAGFLRNMSRFIPYRARKMMNGNILKILESKGMTYATFSKDKL